MDKRALQTYSIWAKNELEKQIEISLKLLGINSRNDIKKSSLMGDYTVIEGDDKTYDKTLHYKRERITSLVIREGYQEIIEEFAYTWFNRIIALRFIELHDYLPHGYRVLSSRDQSKEPEILQHISHLKAELNINLELCAKLKDLGSLEELYRHVLFCQCNTLSNILPMLFSKEEDYLELLLPRQLLIGNTIITRLLEIDESNFLEDVEVIGWLYQFYISSKKDEVFKSKKIITKDTLPAVTQLFTPDWIVRYMTENSIGRLWLESYPNSTLKQDMKYYVEDALQSEEVYQQLEKIKYKNVNPEEIKIIEPCCGSGHILVYAFDLLCKIYEEQGFNKKDIPSLIIKNNLVGLDVDKRASQLASFALIMKARSYNNRFFSEKYFINPKVYEIKDSALLISLNCKEKLKELNILNANEIKKIEYIVETFRYGKVIGSLLKIDKKDIQETINIVYKIKENSIRNIFNEKFLDEGINRLLYLCELAEVLSSKYDVLITNPPYMGISSMEKPVKDYAYIYYPNSKTDMFAMFMETDLVRENGFIAMINQHQWMFINSYEKLRDYLLSKKAMINLLHLGAKTFESISGEVVQSAVFSMRNYSVKFFNGVYIDLTSFKNGLEKEYSFLNTRNNYSFSVVQHIFSHLPSNSLIYWMSDKILDLFKNSSQIIDYGECKAGIMTGDDPIFIRHWHEVISLNISFKEQSSQYIMNTKKWFPLNSGGYCKWYGNLYYIIDLKDKGFGIKNSGKNYRTRDEEYYFKKGIAWSEISTGLFSARLTENGCLFSSTAPMFFPNDNVNLFTILAILNSKISYRILYMLNPTLHYNISSVSALPIIYQSNEIISNVAESCYIIAKKDWDSFETSWDFTKHPFLMFNKTKLYESYLCWEKECCDRFNKLKSNEEELNKILINIYELKNEFTPDVEDKDITINKAECSRDTKSFISYLIGIIMGRYSLDKEGLIYAGGPLNIEEYPTYKPVSAGIVSIYSKLGMSDSLTSKITDLIKIIYGLEVYRENIDFIADSLGKKNNESSEETLNRYLCDDFYNDHLKIYQKRPIYWMFSSGKSNAFKCLVYLHRYNEDTLAIINSKYFLPESTRIKIELEDINKSINSSEGKEKIKLEKEKSSLISKYSEALEYGQILDHKANEYISLDLDDGVKVNYQKFQDIEIINDSGTIVKRNLLIPIK